MSESLGNVFLRFGASNQRSHWRIVSMESSRPLLVETTEMWRRGPLDLFLTVR
ncbi:MAG: hypothetical protein ABI647_14485 [Gemmatimonadota bacterium]